MGGGVFFIAALVGLAAAVSGEARNPARCNAEHEIHAPQLAVLPTAGTANLIKLPQPDGHKATFPAALDGSPYAFYYAKSPTNSTKWTINIRGGGWCDDEKDCLCRSQQATKVSLGSSKHYAATTHYNCKNPMPDGTVDSNCHSIDLLYLDGASFSGFRAEPWAVPGTKEAVWFRGLANLDGTLDWAFQHLGLNNATEVFLSGESAGGW
jgi:hypothetical protein